MSIPSYTVYGSHPRLFFRDTDKAALQARVANAAGWKSVWDNTIIPRANTYKGYTDAAIATTSTVHLRIMVLTLAGYLTETGRPVGGYKAKAIGAAIYLAGIPDGDAPTLKRHRAIALSSVFDILFDDLTTTEKNTLAAEMIQQADRMSFNESEYMDGWSGNDQMAQAACALAGYGWGSFGWAARLTEALTYFYGVDFKGGALTTNQHFSSDGGAFKGSWYLYLDWWAELWFPWMFSNATDFNAWTEHDAWASQVWEYLLWEGHTGGALFDRPQHGDSAYLTNPIFQVEHRWTLGILAGRYPTPDGTEGGEHLRWLYDQWDMKDTPYADNLIFDIVFFDKAAVAATVPEDAATSIPSSRVFEPPGLFYARRAGRGSGYDDWDPDESVSIRVSGRRHYDIGHRHLDSGACQITFKGDRILLAPAGVYDDYGSSHHLGAYQRTWLQSLAPLILDPAQVYQFWGGTQINDGGQHWQKFDTGTEIKSDPYRVWEMVNEGGGTAWLRATLARPSQDAAHQFVSIDLRPCYRKFPTDTYRANPLRVKYLLIEPTAANGLVYPALLYFLRATKTNTDHRVVVPLHTAAAWTLTAYGGHAPGYYGIGRLWVDVRGIANYTVTHATPGTPLDANGYGPNQFKILGAGTNYVPTRAPKTRELPDVKTHSLYVEKTTRVTTEDVVLLLMPTAAGDSEPVSGRAWVSDGAEPDWYGITIGSETYLIHRTQDIVSVGSPDTTPPGEVTSLALQARNQALLATWTDPADADLHKIRVYKRTSEIT